MLQKYRMLPFKIFSNTTLFPFKKSLKINIICCQYFSQVRMAGEPGSGAGKGGGGGGSIREAGGSFGKMEAAKEDQYFYNLVYIRNINYCLTSFILKNNKKYTLLINLKIESVSKFKPRKTFCTFRYKLYFYLIKL